MEEQAPNQPATTEEAQPIVDLTKGRQQDDPENPSEQRKGENPNDDESMAEDKPNEGDDEWKEVGPSGKDKGGVHFDKSTKEGTEKRDKKDHNVSTVVQTKQNRFGVYVSKTGTSTDTSINPDDFQHLFKCIHAIDSQAYIIPCNNDDRYAVPVADLATGGNRDWNLLLDVQKIGWGKPSDGRFKVMFSFWLAANHISKNFSELKKDQDFSKFIAKMSYTVTTHHLHETQSKAVCFYMGKSGKHTYRDDLKQRTEAHLAKQLERKIPVQIRVTTTRVGNTESETVTAFVGIKDHSVVNAALKQVPMDFPETVPVDIRRSNQKEFVKKLQQNNALQSNSGAIKLTKAFDTVDLLPSALDEHFPDEAKKIIDISTTSHFDETGTAYVQCLVDSKKAIHQAVVSAISKIPRSFYVIDPEVTPLTRQDDQTVYSKTTQATRATQKTERKEIPAPPSRFDTLIDERTLASSTTIKTTSQYRIPKAIDPQALSYASVLKQNSSNHSTGDQSATSQLTGNSTIQTQREKELQEENNQLKSEIGTLKNQVANLTTKMDELTETLKTLVALQQPGTPPAQENMDEAPSPEVDSHQEDNVPDHPLPASDDDDVPDLLDRAADSDVEDDDYDALTQQTANPDDNLNAYSTPGSTPTKSNTAGKHSLPPKTPDSAVSQDSPQKKKANQNPTPIKDLTSLFDDVSSGEGGAQSTGDSKEPC